jgi:hypothetical protein
MKLKPFMHDCLLKKRCNWFALIVLGVIVLAAYIFLSLRLLMNPYPLLIAACWLTLEQIFVFSTLFLLLTLLAWSALAWRWSRSISAQLPHRLRHVISFKYTALVIFPMLTLWFYSLLAMIIAVELSSLELWFVAIALSWMTTPFATLGFINIGARIGSWLDRMR